LVDFLERSPSHLSARVQGSEIRPYDVQVSADGDYDCSYPSDIQPCKHVAAVLLYVIQNKEETGFDLKAHLQDLAAGLGQPERGASALA
jgi:uncharacterized Zn finger protein